jgi:hypothetical protein
VQITQVRAGNAAPTEGSLPYIRIERASGATLISRQLAGNKLLIKLEPGAYRLASWQRICDGNCGNLDPPSNQCRRAFSVRQGEVLRAIVRVNFTRVGPASRCAIILQHQEQPD